MQFILIKLDYCNSLLTNVSSRALHHYQDVLNAAERLISGSMTSEQITPVLKSLNWLKIPYRISYKISSIIYKVISYDAPKYLSYTLAKTAAISGRASLRSSYHLMFLVPRSHDVRLCNRSFYVSGPRIECPLRSYSNCPHTRALWCPTKDCWNSFVNCPKTVLSGSGALGSWREVAAISLSWWSCRSKLCCRKTVVKFLNCLKLTIVFGCVLNY